MSAMNCPKCGTDISDSYEPDDWSVGITAGWFCDACDLAVTDDGHYEPHEDAVPIMTAKEFRGDRPLGTPISQLSGQPGDLRNPDDPRHAGYAARCRAALSSAPSPAAELPAFDRASELVARQLASFRLGLDADDPFAFTENEKLMAGHIVGNLWANNLLNTEGEEWVKVESEAALSSPASGSDVKSRELVAIWMITEGIATGHGDTLDDLLREIKAAGSGGWQRDAAQIYVPGRWRCAKCNFELMQSNLNANTGTVTARDDPGDKCPNCNSPLWRVTYKQAYADVCAIAERLCDENRALKSAAPAQERE